MKEGIYPRASATGKSFLKILTRPYRDIGAHFGIGESGASQSNKRVNDKVRWDKKLKR
jgi:hypothetical protein